MQHNKFFTPTVLCWALSLVFCPQAHAEEISACADKSVHNRFDKIQPAQNSGLPIPDNSAIRLTADSIDGTATNNATAQGDVIVEKDEQILNAKLIHYDETQNSVTSPDEFVLSKENTNISGNNLNYNLQTEEGEATNIHFEHQKSPEQRYQGYADSIQMIGKNYNRLYKASLNTCQPNDDSWYIEAGQIDTDKEKNIGVARNAKLVFKGVPILYSPWLDFPLDGNRKSGFLSPTVGGGSEGFEFAIPYYLNLAPNYDATYTPHYYSRRGLANRGEFRYLSNKSHGRMWGELLAHDDLLKQKRYTFHWQNKTRITPSIEMGIDYNIASDNDYYRDLGNRLDSAENVNLNRQLWFSHSNNLWGGAWNNYLNIQRYQTLQNKERTITEPYRLLPQISSQWTKHIDNARISILGQVSRFEHTTLPEGTREVLYPSIRWNFANQWGFLRPKIGVHATAYQLDDRSQKQRTTTRVLPIMSVDSGVIFERNTNIFKKSLTQTLEPRLFYTYIPTREQNHLPNFDSSENTFNYDQLFRENRFSGNDRINAANQLSTAVMSRFYENNTGIERFRAGLGQRFYLKRDNVVINGNVEQREKNRSDLVAFVGGHVNDKWYMQADWHYDVKQERSESYATNIRYNPAPNKTLSVRLGYDRSSTWYSGFNGELKHVDVGIQWPIYKGLDVVARQNYSLTHKRPLDQLLGFQYNAKCGCWSAKLVAQRYVTDHDKTKNAFFLQLQFKGLGGLGSSADDELKRAIPGYHFN